MFKPKNTGDVLSVSEPTKVLCYGFHGFAKTHQIKNYAKRFGKGLIISGEAGLKSVSDMDIDYVPFSSWDGTHDPIKEVYSFRGIMRDMATLQFAAADYKWIAIDSLTEVSERLMEHLEAKYAKEPKGNNFALWQDNERMMTAALKWIRDMPIHVYVTCLAKEETDDSGAAHYWPLLKGSAVSKKIPGLFDHVLCGIRKTDPDPTTGLPRVTRMFVTDEVFGWKGKVRAPENKRPQPVEKCDDITELLIKMSN